MHSSWYVIVDGWVFNREGRPIECKECGSWEFYEYCAYVRHPITLKGRKEVRVERYQCRNCRKTVVQSFDFIDKWKQYAKDAQRVALNARIEDMNSSRHVEHRMERDYDCRPCHSTVRYWCNQVGDRVDHVFGREIVPNMEWNGRCTIHLDEIYTRRRGNSSSLTVAMTHKGYLCLSGRFSDTATSDDVSLLLDDVDSFLVDPWRFVTDGSDIYPSVLKERYPHAKHVVCFFHQLRTISRWEKRLEKESNRFKKMKILRYIIDRFKELFHQIWDVVGGRITNNREERLFNHIRRIFHQIVSFFSLKCGNRFLKLVLFHWDLHRFKRGQYAGKAPVEVMGFDMNGHDWLYYLGFPERKDLERSISSLDILFHNCLFLICLSRNVRVIYSESTFRTD
ncbi:MAG: hypothetical protein E3J35_07220 [Methanomassiliicoccales archaeon]|nr:MAG: hypothetical protein E3J35_07220 [Methanomassiliicoccales archaeon]